ncbi:hypothetical protein T12_734 [Trichinella patagoniensis]|uniref:Uncharacterized protein n=1 Tax=Trichinella patagoniensis TaxID=990121 RepID=A0A0V0ZXG7_9BILA|nr:hypothetical protein T12_734 [Trichinella patagoniensis]
MSVFSLVTLLTGRWLRCVAPAVEVDISVIKNNQLHLLFLLRTYFRPLLDLGRCATLRAIFLPGVFFLVILFDLERDRNDCKHVGQIISEGASVLLTRIKNNGI